MEKHLQARTHTHTHTHTHAQGLTDSCKLSSTQFIKHTNDKHALFQPLVPALTRLHLWFYRCSVGVFYLYWVYLSVTPSLGRTWADI